MNGETPKYTGYCHSYCYDKQIPIMIQKGEHRRSKADKRLVVNVTVDGESVKEKAYQ